MKWLLPLREQCFRHHPQRTVELYISVNAAQRTGTRKPRRTGDRAREKTGKG
ncbi:hypothetical protein LJPFL01_3583 [Lelliottia jeotgali]|nr:hypothetical protein LJPFL01_3583 [Lelliottia jeotgali]